MSRLLDIAVHPVPDAPMQRLSSATIGSAGVTGDVPRKNPKRQVTVVAREAWELTCVELAAPVPWIARRANLLVEGIKLEQTTGKRLRIGAILLEITGETKPCDNMDRQHPGLQVALTPNWRAGVTCHVLEPGEIKVGDAVSWEGAGASGTAATASHSKSRLGCCTGGRWRRQSCASGRYRPARPLRRCKTARRTIPVE